MAQIEVLQGDITRLAVDAVVNAANERMLGGSGVDGAIHRAAGPALLDACLEVPAGPGGVRCPTGEARLTPGFELPARYVIHTVGPVWDGGDLGEPELLASAYRSSLELAAQHGLKTIAFPAISTGVYGYPLGDASSIAVHECRAFLARTPGFEKIVMVAFSDSDAEVLRAAVDAR